MGTKVSVNVWEIAEVENEEGYETPLTDSIIELNPPIAGKEFLQDLLSTLTERYSAESLSTDTWTSLTWTEKLTIPFTAVAGTYTVSVFFQFQYSDNKGMEVRVELNNNAVVSWELNESKKADWDGRQLVMDQTLVAGPAEISLDFRSLKNGKSAQMREARIIIERKT